MLCIAYSADGVALATPEFWRAALREPELANVASQPVGAKASAYPETIIFVSGFG